MITKIRVGNFYSIGEEIELSFVKGGKIEEESYYQYKKDEKVSLINGFYGANASGKSSILNALVRTIRMVYMINPSFGAQQVIDVLLCQPNKHKNFIGKPTTLGIEFLFGSNYYTYELEILEGKKIIKEILRVTTLDAKSARAKVIFTRTGDRIVLGPEYEAYKKYVNISKVQSYQTFISHLINNVGAPAVQDFIDYRESFFLKTDEIELQMPSIFGAPNMALRYSNFSESEKKEFKKVVTTFLSCFNNSIIDIDLDSTRKSPVTIRHKDFVVDLDVMAESAGTRELFYYVYDLFSIFKKGGVVIYDETSRYYHPDMESALLQLFVSDELNAKHAQLFFSSHNHETFDLLEQDQAHIVEVVDAFTTVFKLSEVEDLQKRDNLKKKYRLGMFGGVPDVIDFTYKIKQLL